MFGWLRKVFRRDALPDVSPVSQADQARLSRAQETQARRIAKADRVTQRIRADYQALDDRMAGR